MSALAATRRERRARLALALGSVAVTWLALEIPGQLGWVRYYHLGDKRSIFLAAEPWRNPTLVMHDDRFFRRIGGTHLVGETPGDMAVWLELPGETHAFDVRYDAAGFRNRTPSHDAAIAVIGDSFVEAPLVPDEALLAAQLERELGRRAATFGHLGYGPQQELDVLRDEALPHPREWIVWAFFEGNDLADHAGYAERMPSWRFERVWKRSLAYTVATKLAPTKDAAAERERARAQVSKRSAPSGSESVEILLGARVGPWIGRRSALLADAVATLATARDESEARGARFLAVFVPTKETVYHPVLDGVAPPPGPSMASAFLEACAAHGIAGLDLTEPLRAQARSELVYFSDDAHWNGAGIAVAAAEIAREIRVLEAAAAP